MKFKFFAAAMIAAILLLALTACGNTQSPTTSDQLNSADQQTEQQNDSENSANKDSSAHGDEDSKNESASTGKDETSSTNGNETTEEEPWKAALAEVLFEKYGVLPEYYEDLGDGIYQVYAEVGGKVVPFVTVDSATGDYHG